MRAELTAEQIEQAIRWVGSQFNRCIRPGEAKMLRICLAALRTEQERMNPQPLTWEELSEMVGEPVWTIGEFDGLNGWDIVEEVYPADKEVDESILFGRTTERPHRWNYNLRDLNGEPSYCAWVCYRTKPEGSDKA